MAQLTEARERLAAAEQKRDHLTRSIGEAQRIIAECRAQAGLLAGDVGGEIDNNVRLESALNAQSRLERERYQAMGLITLLTEQVEKLDAQRRWAEEEVTTCELALLDWQAKRRGERLRAVVAELGDLVGDMNGIANGRHVSLFRDAVTTMRSIAGAYTTLQTRYDAARAQLAKLGE